MKEAIISIMVLLGLIVAIGAYILIGTKVDEIRNNKPFLK